MDRVASTISALEHPLRRELHDELHARPSLYFEGEADIWHVAIVSDPASKELPQVLLELGGRSGGLHDRHGIASFGGGRLKWELHTEFVSVTFIGDATGGEPPPGAFLNLCGQIGGQVISAAKVLVRYDMGEAGATRPGQDFVASSVGGGDAEVYSNFRLNEHGFTEILMFNRRLNAYRSGRMVRRLIEIETYRMMALLAVPVAHATVDRLASFDARLGLVVDHMQEAAKVDKALLVDVTRLSSDLLEYSAGARHRFSATRAYAQIVDSRLAELREDRVVQRQRIGTFIDRRFQPAMRYVQAAERRLDELAGRVGLAGDLLRTTLQVQLEDQNASLLASVEERARIQVHIQQAVEGFSILAISYYAIGLMKAFLDGLTEAGFSPGPTKPLLVVAVPLALLAVWAAVRQVRKRIASQPHGATEAGLKRHST